MSLLTIMNQLVYAKPDADALASKLALVDSRAENDPDVGPQVKSAISSAAHNAKQTADDVQKALAEVQAQLGG
jgi:hypothetical protein